MKVIIILILIVKKIISVCMTDMISTVCSNYSSSLITVYNLNSYCQCNDCPSGSIIDNIQLSCCQNTVLNCVTCIGSASAICTECINSSYAVNALGSCDLCSTLLSNCELCSSNSVCNQCLSTFYLNSTNSSNCVSCGTAFSNCVTCTENNCTNCFNSSFAVNSLGICDLCTTLLGHC